MSHRGLTTGAFAWILDFERLFTCTLLSLRACVTLLVPTGSWKLLRKKEFQWDTSFKSHCIPVCPSLTQTQMFVSVCVCVCVCAHALSCVQLFCNPVDVARQAPLLWDSPGKNTGAGCHFLLQGFSWPRDRTRVCRVSCIGRWIPYHQGSPNLDV